MATRVDINMALAEKLAMDACERGVRAATIEARTVAVMLHREPKGGRVYTHRFWTDAAGRLRRGKKRDKPHTASAPGESPAVDSGELLRRITTEVVRGPKEVVGYLIANIEYAAGLELGTEKVKARPWLSRIPREFGDRLRYMFTKFAGV